MARRARGCVGRSSGRWGAVPQRRAMTSWETEPRAGVEVRQHPSPPDPMGGVLRAACVERRHGRGITGASRPRLLAAFGDVCRILFPHSHAGNGPPAQSASQDPAHRSAKGKPCFAGLSHLWERGGHHRGITRTGSGGHIGLTGDRRNGLVERKAFRQPLPCVRRLLTPGQGPHFHPGRGFRTRPARPWSRSAWCRQRKQGTCTARNRASPVTAASSGASPAHCRAIATRSRSSGEIRWSASSASSPRSICTQLTVPLKTLLSPW